MKKGFTLVEVLVALTIISILTLVVMQIYMTITKLEIESQEEDYARITIQNVHRSFIADPVTWETTLYESYGVNPPAVFDSELRFDSNWQLLEENETGVYTILYIYEETIDADSGLTVYSLYIDVIASDHRTIFAAIDLGKMVKP